MAETVIGVGEDVSKDVETVLEPRGVLENGNERCESGMREWAGRPTLEAMRFVLSHSKHFDKGQGNQIKLYRKMFNEEPKEFWKELRKLEGEEAELERLRLQSLIAPPPAPEGVVEVVVGEPDKDGLDVIELMERLLSEIEEEGVR